MLSFLSLLTVLAVEPKPGDLLPLRKLRLYETGVGYFERRGGVGKSSELALPLPASHLDDALKTLVILDGKGDARVSGVEFATAISESGARAMAGLPSDPEGAIDYGTVLLSLEGADVEIDRAGGKIRGRVLEVEGPFSRAPATDETAAATPASELARDAAREAWYAVVVVDDEGGIHRVRTTEVRSVRALDRGSAERLQVAASALSDQSARRRHPFGIRVANGGQLGLGYIAETPVWRTTYRVVLPDRGQEAELQAWALVHNDTDEHWKGVSLELANGRPQSFLYPLAAPRYTRRELTGPEEDLSTVPQLANTTVDRLWGDHEGSLGISGIGYGGGGSGEGTIGLGNVGVIGKGGGGGTSAGGPHLGDLAELSKAEGEESGALFVYRVLDPLDLDAHHSALVPIVQQPVEAESITWFPAREDVALSGARLVNTTNQTLPPGVVSFFADGGFVGEASLDRLKPKQRQFVAFGSELDVDLERHHRRVSSKVVGVVWDDHQLLARDVVEDEISLVVTNRSGRDRKVYVALDVERNAKITGGGEGVELDYDDEVASALAIVGVAGGKSVERKLTVQRASTGRRIELDVDELAALADMASIPDAQRRQIAAALTHARRRDASKLEASRLADELTARDEELERVRADLAAVGKARTRGRVADRLAKRLLAAEDEVDRLRAAQRAAEIDSATSAGRAVAVLREMGG